MSKLAEIYVELSAKTAKLKQGLTKSVQMSKESAAKIKTKYAGLFGKLSNMAKDLFQGIIKWAKRAALAVVALTGVLIYKSIKAWQAQEKAENDVSAALRSTGQEVKNNTKLLKEQMSAIQKVTSYSDEYLLSLAAMSIGMGASAKEAGDMVKTAIGFAKKLGREISPEIVKYALQIQLGQLEALQEMVPQLRTVTAQAEKLAIVQQFVAEGYQAANAEMDVQTGRLKLLREAIGNVLEQLGRILTTGAADKTKSWIDGLRKVAVDLETRLKGVRGQLDDIKRVARDLLDMVNEFTGMKFGKGNFIDEIKIAVYELKLRVVGIFDYIKDKVDWLIEKAGMVLDIAEATTPGFRLLRGVLGEEGIDAKGRSKIEDLVKIFREELEAQRGGILFLKKKQVRELMGQARMLSEAWKGPGDKPSLMEFYNMLADDLLETTGRGGGSYGKAPPSIGGGAGVANLVKGITTAIQTATGTYRVGQRTVLEQTARTISDNVSSIVNKMDEQIDIASRAASGGGEAPFTGYP